MAFCLGLREPLKTFRIYVKGFNFNNCQSKKFGCECFTAFLLICRYMLVLKMTHAT